MRTERILTIVATFAVGIGLLITVGYLFFCLFNPLPGSKVAIPPKAEKVVALAQSDLATRLKINPKEVQLIGLEEVQWRDSCLGIHEPGVQCLQVITPGYRLFLQANKKIFVYHTGLDSVRLIEVP